MARSDREKWEKFNELLIDAIDIEAECKEWGLEFTGNVSSQNFAECSAPDREDRHASAAVNLQTGYYKDLGPGASMPFFRFAVEYGPYSSFFDAQKTLARKYKVRMPTSMAGKSFWSRFRPSQWSDLSVLGFCNELKVTPSTLQLVGCSLGLTTLDQSAVIFPVYHMLSPFERPQCGIVLMNSAGGKIRKYAGRGGVTEELRNYSMGSSGVINRHALHQWQNAVMIYKVEGISDMLRLQHEIEIYNDGEFLNKHLVVTNSAGCDAAQDAHRFGDLARGKVVAIIHDHDEPGQFGSGVDKQGGAVRWFNSLQDRAQSVGNICLYSEEPLGLKKGRDLRDWFDSGNGYGDLIKLVQEQNSAFHQRSQNKSVHGQDLSHPETLDQNLSDNQVILRSLNLSVLGHHVNGSIDVFNHATMQKYNILNIDQLSYNKQLVYFGEAAREQISDPDDEDSSDHKFDSSDVRKSIAEEGGRRSISETNMVGIGIWESNGRLFAVGTGEYMAVNGGLEVFRKPMVDDMIVDFGMSGEEWYDGDRLHTHLEQARSQQWCESVYNELAGVLGSWGNHTHPLADEMLSALVIASFSQSCWDWRPWVAVTGESSSGKTLLFSWIAELFGNLVIASSNASEAGIRNTIRDTSKILMLDEFESSSHRSRILEMLMATNRQGKFGQSLRSNASQSSVSSQYRLIPWFSATEMKRDKQTEANRYLTFELSGKPKWIDLETILNGEYLDSLRNRLIAVAMRCTLRAKELIRYIARVTVDEYTRQGESYMLIAGIYSAIHGFSEDRAVEFYRSLLAQLKMADVVEDEEREQDLAMQAILSSPVRGTAGRIYPISSLLSLDHSGHDDSDDLLNRIGIRRISAVEAMRMADYKKAKKKINVSEGSYIFIDTSKSGAIRRELLKGTDYDRQDLRTILSRISGAIRTTARTGLGLAKGVMVPLERVGGEVSPPWPSQDPDDFVSKSDSDLQDL